MNKFIGWRAEQNISYKGVESSILHMRFKTLRLTAIHIEPKRTISISSGFQRLQMVSDLKTEKSVSARTLGSQGRVVYKISHRLERETKHSL